MKTIYYGRVLFADGTVGTLQIRYNNEGVVGTMPHTKPWEPLPSTPYNVMGSMHVERFTMNGEGDARTEIH